MKQYEVAAVGSAEEALEQIANGDFEVVLLDVWLPGMDGMEALGRIQGAPRAPAVIMISGHGNIETAVRATKLRRIRLHRETPFARKDYRSRPQRRAATPPAG